MSKLQRLKTMIPERWRESLRDVQVARSLQHVSGPKTAELGPQEAAVTCLVKNGDFYLDQFVAHYTRLGFARICFLDNGSTDTTVDRATRYPNVSVYRSTVPIAGLQRQLKRSIVNHFVGEGWCLDVDIDEFFDYPESDVVPLGQLVDHLNAHRYTAMMTQMVDMFSDAPLASLSERRDESLRDVHVWYDLSNVTGTPYRDEPLTRAYGSRNTVPGKATVFWGGIRLSIWGVNCLLTKHSLFRAGAGVELFPHVHYVDCANLADVSGALLHYKCASNASAEATQNSAAFTANGKNYDRALKTIVERPDLQLKTATAERYSGASELLERGLLFASEAYRALALR